MERYHILVVDDDVQIVRSLSKLLELEGYIVYQAFDGMGRLTFSRRSRCISSC